MGLFDFFSKALSDKYTDKKGYKRYKDSDKPVHRYVAEKKIGRKLKPTEVVHHKDRDKQNNSPNNLWVTTPAEHRKIHEKDAKRFGKKASYQGFKKKNK